MNTPRRFRKRPVEAIYWGDESTDAVCEFVGSAGQLIVGIAGKELVIDAPDEILRAYPGHWIIKDAEGNVYPCEADIFETTYEPVGDDG